jgi:hypothetical protein
MKKLMENWNNYTKEVLTEKSLSRTWTHMQDYQTALITAFRDNPDDDEGCVMDSQPVEGEDALDKNKMRNRDLKATLLSFGYGVTAVQGTYIENYMKDNAIEVKEPSFFVHNQENDPKFFANLEMLAQKFCQDSVLLVPQGGEGAYFKGTNGAEFPGLGKSQEVGKFRGGEEGQFMTRVGNRPFVMRKEGIETYKSHSRLSRMAISAIAKRVLK